MSISLIFGGVFGLMLNYLNENDSASIIICLLISKFGISTAISLCYVLTPFFFPVVQSSRAFSYLCAKGKFFAMLAPMIAEK